MFRHGLLDGEVGSADDTDLSLNSWCFLRCSITILPTFAARLLVHLVQADHRNGCHRRLREIRLALLLFLILDCSRRPSDLHRALAIVAGRSASSRPRALRRIRRAHGIARGGSVCVCCGGLEVFCCRQREDFQSMQRSHGQEGGLQLIASFPVLLRFNSKEASAEIVYVRPSALSQRSRQGECVRYRMRDPCAMTTITL